MLEIKEPIPNSYGTLTYEDTKGNKCTEIGFFNENLRLYDIGHRKIGDKQEVIAKFNNGFIIDETHLNLKLEILNKKIRVVEKDS